MDMYKEYGVKEMSLNEEIMYAEQHPAKAKTRANKIRINQYMKEIQQVAKYWENYARAIPEEDSDRHAELVECLANGFKHVKDTFLYVEESLFDGFEGWESMNVPEIKPIDEE